ncbi:hypothetical protein TARUN_6576 [Trichoderma arundinaceum]|uniref:Uncharacterized protein n=1 Tax=Trichoderma arundinaceum TaxID=490622 RepID=A0A395NIQ5_TRIAR|nr:hypothetical protein TARUN_6576 [Trichoderma arundinaceum]
MLLAAKIVPGRAQEEKKKFGRVESSLVWLAQTCQKGELDSGQLLITVRWRLRHPWIEAAITYMQLQLYLGSVFSNPVWSGLGRQARQDARICIRLGAGPSNGLQPCLWAMVQHREIGYVAAQFVVTRVLLEIAWQLLGAPQQAGVIYCGYVAAFKPNTWARKLPVAPIAKAPPRLNLERHPLAQRRHTQQPPQLDVADPSPHQMESSKPTGGTAKDAGVADKLTGEMYGLIGIYSEDNATRSGRS